MKLFGIFGRGHTPDIDELSAMVDGALDASATAALEAHVAGCDACAAELDGLRRVKSMLAALPQAAPSRAFQVRQAEVEAAPRTAGAPAGGLLRAMPALTAAAAFVFVATLATDFSTRDGTSERQASSGPAVADSAERSLEMEDAGTLAGDGDDAAAAGAEATMQYAATPSAAAGAIAPEASGDEPTDGSAGGGEIAGDTAAPDDADAPPSGVAESPAPAPQSDAFEAANAETSEDDDGNRAAFVIVEVVAGAVALGALALFIYGRRKRSEGLA
jgi:anti-sigma factor RsiW